MSAHVEPDGSLAFRQVTSTARWRLDEDLDHRSRARDRARARAFRVADRYAAPALRARRSGARQRRQRRPRDQRQPRARRLRRGRRQRGAATPGLRRTTSGYRGSASDPWRALETMENLHPYDAVEPGNVVQAAATAVDGKRHQTMTLAIGFGRDQAAARATATRSLDGGFAQAERRYPKVGRTTAPTREAARAACAGDAELRAVYEQSLLVLAASEDKTLPRRVDRLAQHAVDLGHPEARAGSALGPVPPRLASRPLPRGHRAEGRGRRRGGRSLAGLPVAGPEAGRRLVAEHVRRRAPEVDDRAARPGLAPDRARLVAGPHGRGRLGARRAGRRLPRQQRGPAAQQSGALGEPGRLLAQHDRHRDRRPDLRRRHRAHATASRSRRQRTRRSQTTGSGASRAGPRPRTARTRPGRTTCA